MDSFPQGNNDMARSILDAVGNTPLVEIRKLNPNPNVRILAKLEYFNPGGSIKDRAALAMIEAGERSGELTPAKTVIEATSGNTGIGLALVCSVKGYRILLAMSEAVSVERQKILKARGADIMLTPGHLGTDGAIEEVYRLARENPDQYFMTDQYNNPANWQAHYNGTAPEIWEQTGGSITMLVATMGTTGTLMGMSARLKEYNPEITVVGVEPYLGHKIQGLKNLKEAYCPEIYEKQRLDRKVNVDDEEAFEMTRQLAREEGLFVGMSSGAAMAIAVEEAARMTDGTIVVIFPDSGERYLSTSLFTVRDTVELKLFNTLTRKKEIFQPLRPGEVSMYSCGPIAHDRMNLSECRRLVFSDLLRRYLEYRGYTVKHVMNITDLDDKTIIGSERAGIAQSEYTAHHIDMIRRDLDQLGVSPATACPLTSEHVEDMVQIAEKLVSKGFAYEKLRSLYFDISRFSSYGNLSGVDLNKIRLGATVDLDEYEKDNPRDFTLFKRSKLSELKRGIYTKTEWGNVRPSWHIQCAAISMKYLGAQFDVHASSRELVFPHHENEIAISQALTGKPPARFWIHCDRVMVDGKKLDEAGNGPTLQQLNELGYSGRDIRYWLLAGHYRKPVTCSRDRLDTARRSLRRVNSVIHTLMTLDANVPPYPEIDQLVYDLRHGFTLAMDDDLNTSAAMASIFTVVKRVNVLLQEKRLSSDDAEKLVAAFRGINQVLQVFDGGEKYADPEVKQLLKQRELARAEKNWALADEIRNQLREKGLSIRDQKVSRSG